MSSAGFELEIVSQGWLGEPSADWDPERDDLCSHGDLRLVIGGRVIAAGDGSGDYTISTSALALLRTLESDHGLRASRRADGARDALRQAPHDELPVRDRLGGAHRDGRVFLSDVVKNETERLPGVAADLSEDEYRRAIVAFAEVAKEPFARIEKSLDESTRAEYEAFWREYDERLDRAARG